MELSPEALREVRFTERFRGYDAAEVDAFLSEASEALEELLAERSAPLAALAAERARLAIEEVQRQTLAEITKLQTRRDELAQTVADFQLMLADRRRGLAEALALIDATSEPAPDPGDGAEAADGRQDAAEGDGDSEAAPGGDSFLARLERAAEGGDPSG